MPANGRRDLIRRLKVKCEIQVLQALKMERYLELRIPRTHYTFNKLGISVKYSFTLFEEWYMRQGRSKCAQCRCAPFLYFALWDKVPGNVDKRVGREGATYVCRNTVPMLTACGLFLSLPSTNIKKRYSVPITGPVVIQSVGTGIALLFHDSGTRRG